MRLRTFALTWLTITIAVALFGLRAHAAVWETTADWTEAAEANYRQWVATNWKKDYFTQPGPLQDSIMDCADVVYAMRIIYASQNGLPFVMKDPTTARGIFVTNEMTRWDNRPEAQRLRGFLDLIHAIGSTMSLPNDSYPTAIGPSTLGSGSMILTDPEKHHSWTIRNFSVTGIPYLLFGSRPAKTMLLDRNDYPSVPFVFPQGIRPETNAGFRNFRKPADIGKPVHEVPGYSLEQYDFDPPLFMKTVQKRMQQMDELPQQRVARLLNEACKGARERIEGVREGVKKNLSLGSTCMTESEYDDLSTPSRDQRMKETFVDLVESYRAGVVLNAINGSLTKQMEALINGAANGPNVTCRIEIAPGKKVTLGQVYVASVNGKLSSNPHDTLEMRWGLEFGPSAKAQSCPVY